ncbi:MAG: YbhB/YbcL family Raf kinase inhibitor-like protein, partial [Bacteroidales bacterium]
WIVYNIPAKDTELEEIIPKQKTLDNGAIQGRNDFGKYGYGGPCPPKGESHRYYFHVFALDRKLGREDGASRDALLDAIDGHVIEKGEYMGTYRRQ